MANETTISRVLNKDPQTSRLSPKKLKEYIDGIYEGSITEYDLPEDVYEAIVNYLKAGLYKGFGMTLEEAEGKDLELLTELRESVYMFGAAKTYQQTKEISSLLFDEDGNLRTAKEFNDIARETYDNWTDNWGQTEYNTAVGQASSAAKWNEIEKQKDILPYLRYSAIMDANTSEICAPLDGIVAPVDDPMWASVGPLNHWNCRCVLLQEDKETVPTPADERDDKVDQVEKEMQPIFKNNPGQSGEIFTKDHPYFDVPKEDKGFAMENFGLPIPSIETEIPALEEKITASEEEAVSEYTRSWAYPKIQAYLRNGAENEYTEYVKEVVQKIDSYLAKADKFEGTTYRGLQFDKKETGFKELVKAIKGHGELIDKSFMSTSEDDGIAKEFMNHPGKESVLFEIEGKSGVSIANLARDPGEMEVLFPRDTKFKVVSYQEKDFGRHKTYKVKLREL